MCQSPVSFFYTRKHRYGRRFETRAIHLNKRKHNIWFKDSLNCSRTTIYCAFFSLFYGESLNYGSR